MRSCGSNYDGFMTLSYNDNRVLDPVTSCIFPISAHMYICAYTCACVYTRIDMYKCVHVHLYIIDCLEVYGMYMYGGGGARRQLVRAREDVLIRLDSKEEIHRNPSKYLSVCVDIYIYIYTHTHHIYTHVI